MENPLVLIEWLDSKGVIGEWEFIDSLSPLIPCECTSVGFLVEDKKEYKTIVQTKSNEQVVGRMTIPTCSIKKIRKISV
jgi:hypothetical protein